MNQSFPQCNGSFRGCFGGGTLWLSLWIRFLFFLETKALFSALSTNHRKNLYHSRLVRYVDRLLIVNFSIKHLIGKDMGFTNLISRIPSRKSLSQSNHDKEFVMATSIKLKEQFIFLIIKNSYAIRLVQFWINPITQDYIITYKHQF